ncbi:MAG: CoA-transferase [Deltaproteobacteria bacterium]|nr:CoA-transferase [Deltaproteobacteria bacterium]MCB9785123.1 CoA-transferase [Deltaproteobacteria bacterium]
MSNETFSRADICVVACAEAFRGDGELLASPMGTIPRLGARLAKRTFEPDLVLSDGEAFLVDDPGAAEPVVEGWLPYRHIFGFVWHGRRHVLMGATQIDRYGNQNISAIGDFQQPKVQLLGVRGAPGNTINHPTSYWVPRHGPRVMVEKVDVVCGVGYDRAAALGPRAARFHEIRVVVSDLAVMDFDTPDHRMRLRSVHPGVSVADVVAKTGFELVVPDEVPETRLPTAGELRLIREVLDPDGTRLQEVPG